MSNPKLARNFGPVDASLILKKERHSYCQSILDRLKHAQGNWVQAVDLAEEGGLSYTRRIHELRARGHVIEIEYYERQSDGRRLTRYRLVESAPELPTDRQSGLKVPPCPSNGHSTGQAKQERLF